MPRFSLLLIFCLALAASQPMRDTVAIRDIAAGFLDSKDEILPPPNTSAAFASNPSALADFENGRHFQGDMVLLPEQENLFSWGNGGNRIGMGLLVRMGFVKGIYKWPVSADGTVVVPYTFDSSSKFSTLERTMVRLSMDYLEMYTCIRFVERKSEADFVLIYSGAGCFADIGKRGGKQEVSLERNSCFSRGIILHELIHALGFDHMQNHVDRDKFVTVVWENIAEEDKKNFRKVNLNSYSNFGTPYDYISVMHYGTNSFSRNGKPTVVPTDRRYRNRIGQRRGLSRGDAQRINAMYECKGI